MKDGLKSEKLCLGTVFEPYEGVKDNHGASEIKPRRETGSFHFYNIV